jgi:hypothetical protein
MDHLLLGGIPEKYALAFSLPTSSESTLIVRHFVETGVEAGETTFHVTSDPNATNSLAENYPQTFVLFICNPSVETGTETQPNVFKLNGIDSLTEIDIVLNKAFRTLDPSQVNPKRACIEILSEVLLQHGPVATRRWLSGLLPALRAKGFTTIAVLNPQMHSEGDLHAILGLFQGEVVLSETETAQGIQKTLKIRRLLDHSFLGTEFPLAPRNGMRLVET